jgi:transcriptional regulator GlxA family with amidase domain
VLLNPATSVRWPSSPCNSQLINVWTSAGITAGIDLALALIEEDHGFAIAKGVAQHLVVYHRRHGGQSQFAASVDLAPKNDETGIHPHLRAAASIDQARSSKLEAAAPSYERSVRVLNNRAQKSVMR